MLTRLAGSTPVLGMEKFDNVRKWPRLLPKPEPAGLFPAAPVSLCYNRCNAAVSLKRLRLVTCFTANFRGIERMGRLQRIGNYIRVGCGAFKRRATTPRFLRWLLAGFIASAFPLYFPQIIAHATGAPVPDFYEVIKRGDTYLFCAIVLIGPIGEIFGSKKEFEQQKVIVGVFTALLALGSMVLYNNLYMIDEKEKADLALRIQARSTRSIDESNNGEDKTTKATLQPTETDKHQVLMDAIYCMIMTGFMGAWCIMVTEETNTKGTP